MFFRLLSGLLISAMLLGSALTAQAQQTLNFGIISTEASQNLKVLWEPFLRDMSKALGMEVKAFLPVTMGDHRRHALQESRPELGSATRAPW